MANSVEFLIKCSELYIDKNGPNGCWIWLKAKLKSGYGVFSLNGKSKKVHRIIYEFYKGKIPKGKIICHKCDNPPRCNPDHLFAGTYKDNNSDRAKKGRNRNQYGENHNNVKLTEKQVLEIRAKYVPSKYTIKMLAKEYNVSQALICLILKNKRWKHI